MKLNYKIEDLESQNGIFKPVKLTINRSKFHMDEYVHAFEVFQAPIDPAYRGPIAKGDLVVFKSGAVLVQALPDLYIASAYDILCKLSKEVLSE